MAKEFGQRLDVKKNLIGQMLIKKNIITQIQLDKALAFQKEKGGMLGDALVSLGFISQESLSITIASQTELVYLPIDRYNVSKEALKLIPKELVLKYLCVPLEKISEVLIVAMANPLDKEAISQIEQATQYKLIPMIATRDQVEGILKKDYNGQI